MGVARSLAVQSVLYGNAADDIERAARAVAHSVRLAIADGLVDGWTYRVGDCSPSPVLDERAQRVIGELVEAAGGVLEVTHFGANLGSAAGQNRLASAGTERLMLILNPDAIVGPDTVTRLVAATDEGVGIAEARQVPIEHPKDYDQKTGDTSWASTACALTRRDVFDQVGGFDSETFFLYCDDVDYSWRVRLAGFRVVFVPAATVFHDKRLGVDGSWLAGAAEHYYSAEAALLLPMKYSRPAVVRHVRALLEGSGEEYAERAVREVDRRIAEGRVPTPIDPHHKVGQFVDNNYARHRFP